MMADRTGVAGFFEDIPILVFVLLGVSTLVLSGVWVSQRLTGERIQDRLDRLAGALADHLVAEVLELGSYDGLPRVSSVGSLNLTEHAREELGARGYEIAVLERYPEFAWVKNQSSGDPLLAESTGYASMVFNAVDDNGYTQIMEVRVLVW